MTTCVFPGSFDPVTNGHYDLIRRAASIFDRVTVAVMINVRKIYLIPVEYRVQMLEKLCADLPNVRIDVWNGLLADYMRKQGEHIILRGVRSYTEYDQEMSAAGANRLLNDRTETILIPTSPQYSGVSSSAVKEIFSFGGDIRAFVPEVLKEEIIHFLSKEI